MLLINNRGLNLTLDQQYHSLEQLYNAKSNTQIHTLQDFIHSITSTNIGKVASNSNGALPTYSVHVHSFLTELALCGDLADWVSSFLRDEDLRHEVDKPLLCDVTFADNVHLLGGHSEIQNGGEK